MKTSRGIYQGTNTYNTGKVDVDLRGNLEVGGPDEIPKSNTPGGSVRAQEGDKEFPGSAL